MSRKNNAAFSLIELAVTLVVIGILVAAITSGSHLLQAAKINKVISEIKGYSDGIENFRLKYNGWPGDLPNAANLWGATTSNGNGNEQISGNTTESLLAWQHLTLGNFIVGSYTGLDAGTADFSVNVNVPPSVIKPAYYFLSYNGDIFNTKGNFLQLGTSQNDTSPWGSALTPSDAYIIDKKIDDGKPTSGNIFFFRGDEVKSDDGFCVTGVFDTDNSADAILTDNTISCRLILWLDKK